MSIYAALGHRIHVLEHRNIHLNHKVEVARDALEHLLSAMSLMAQIHPDVSERYASLFLQAEKALKESKS